MKMPVATWLSIVVYADFCDVPRWALAGNNDAGFWLLDSQFDDDADEYPPFFRAKFVGTELEAARAVFDTGTIGDVAAAEVIALDEIQFDPTVRASVMRRV